LIPLKGYIAISVWPFVFARKDAHDLTEVDINHKSIHCRQQIEFMIISALVIGILVLAVHLSLWWFLLVPFIFYIWYGIEYFIRFVICGDNKKAYRGIAVEQEAYVNEDNLSYLKTRKWFAWIRYY
jgi:Ca2+/Na+ antiporter